MQKSKKAMPKKKRKAAVVNEADLNNVAAIKKNITWDSESD